MRRHTISASIFAGLIAMGTASAIVATPGCNGASDPNGRTTGNPTAATTWTLLMYAMGRNESGNAADDATKQIGQANVSANVNFEVAFAPINLGTLPFASARRIAVNKGAQTIISDQGAAPLSEPGELGGYVGTGARIGASQRYCLVIHGHGGGPTRPIGNDTTAAVASLDLAGLDTALTNGRGNAGLQKIDVVVLDVPHSATVEAMSVLAKHASFMVAHQGAAPSTGFDYSGVISAFGTNPSIDARSLANQIATGLTARVSGSASRQLFETSAVAIDLSKVGQLQNACTTFGAALSADIVASGSASTAAIAAIASARESAIECDVALRTHVVDLGDFAARISSGSFGAISSTTVGAANSVITAINGAITTSAVGSNTTVYAPGKRVGIYFPPSASSALASYQTSAASFILASPAWNQFVTNYHTAISGLPAPVVALNTVPGTLSTGQTFTVTANVTPATLIRDVTLLLTIPQSGSNVALFRVPLGTPLSSGAVAYTGSANTIGVIVSGGTLPCPIGRLVRSNARFFAIDADVRYTVSGADTFRAGIVKVGSIAGVGTAGTLVPVTWTAVAPGANAIARNDRLQSSGVTVTIFPRVITVSPSGVVASSAQASVGVPVPGIENLVLDNAAPLSATPVVGTFWVIAEGVNGAIGVATANVTVN